MMKGLFILLCSFLLCSGSARDGHGGESMSFKSADHPDPDPATAATVSPGLMGSTSAQEDRVESDNTTPESEIKSNTTASVSGEVKTEFVTSASTGAGTGTGAGVPQLVGNETETESEKLRFDYPNLEQPKEKSDSNFMNYTQQVKNFTQKFTQTLGQQILELFQSKNQTKMSDEAGSRDAAEDATHDHHVDVDSGEVGEAHETQDLHIQDLLRGILVDEFESGEDESGESAESVESDELESFFHDGSDGNQEQDEDGNGEEDEQIVGVSITTGAPESSSTSTTATTATPTTTSTNTKATSEDVGEQNDRLTETKAEVDAVIVKERQRTGRASISIEKSENDGSDGLVKSGRGRDSDSGKQKGSGSGSNVDKYNRYVDAVFKRMNSLIRAKRMDPLRVNLYAGSNANNASHQHANNNNNNSNNSNGNSSGGTKGSSGGKINKNKNNMPNKNKKNAPTAKPSNVVRPGKNQNVNQKNRNSNNNNNKNKNKRGNNNSNNNNNNKQAKINRNHHHYSNKRRVHTRPRFFHRETQVYGQRRGRAESSTSEPFTDSKMRPSSMESNSSKGNKTSVDIVPSSTTTTTTKTTEKSIGTSSPSTISTTTNASESKEMKGQSDSSSSRPNNSSNNNRPTRGVLHGLSTLRRSGPVKVIRQGPDVRLVRAKFLLGPVALDILPKKSGNSSKASNTATATATARSLKGMLEIRLKNSSPTRIRRLRVFPPSNVRVEGETKGIKKQGYRKITPVAARRLMNVANQVVRQSDNNENKSTPITRTHTKNSSPKNAKRNQNKTPTRPHQKQ